MKTNYIILLTILGLFFTKSSLAQMDMMNALPSNLATHTAVQNGDWFSASTWDNGVPSTGAIVHIPSDKTVNYEGSSGNHIFAIRVDGNFNITQTNANSTSRIKFDTFFATQTSYVTILANNPSDGNIIVNIEPFDIEAYRSGSNIWSSAAESHFRDNGVVTLKTRTGTGSDRYDTYEQALNGNFQIIESAGTTINDGKGVLGRYSWDPKQLSLGMVTMGQLEIIGQEKLNKVKLAADANPGQNNIQLAELPIGWKTNDDIIITRGGNASTLNNGEDQAKIQSVSGTTVTLTSNLSKRHEGRPEDNLHCYVGNLTRNILFKSPNTSVVTRRGHVMAMHNDTNVQIKNAQFLRLGRTDKSKLLDDFVWNNWLEPKVFISKVSPLGQEIAEMRRIPENEITNSRGRYSIHLHKLGTAFGSNMAQVTGNVVWDNPGWGITHHDSHANVSNNVVYDIVGAGIVSETGSETGTWDDNLVVKITQGHSTDPYTASLHHDDYLYSGDGLAMKGRAVLCRNNVIANAKRGVAVINMNNSINNLDRLDAQALATTRLGYEVDNFPLSVNGYSKEGDGVLPVEAALIMENTTVIFANIGLRSVERDMGVNSETRSIFDGFKAWGINTGLAITYQADYSFKNVFISGKNPNTSRGIDMWKHSHNHTFENIKMVDLEYAVQVSKVVLSNSQGPKTRNNGFTPWVFVNLTTSNVGDFYELTVDNPSANPSFDYTEHTDNPIFLNSSDISSRPTTFTILDDSTLEVDYTEVGENALRFEVDGIITDDFGSYDMGIRQALAQGTLREGYPTRIYQFASQAKFQEYLTANGVYKDDSDQLYFILNESLPNRRTFEYTTFPIRVKIKNPSSGMIADAQVESATALAPKNKIISRLATVSQSSTRDNLNYDDGTHDGKTITLEAEKAIDGNNNGRLNAQYYQRDLVPVGSFSETKIESEPYYDLDFGENKIIEYFDIWNTVELNGSDIETLSSTFKNFSVFISDTPFTSTTFSGSKAEADYEYIKNSTPTRKFSQNNLNAEGRYMRIQSSNPTTTRLVFAEIEVVGRSNPVISTAYIYDSGSWTPSNPSGVSTSNDIINVISGNASNSTDNISADTQANILTISPGAKLVINNNGALTASNFDNQGELTIRSNSTKYGTLITNNIINTGIINYRRYVNANASMGGNDLISAPLFGETFGDFAEYLSNENVIFSNPNNNSQKLFGPFDKTTNTYLLYDTATSDANIILESGIGYRSGSIATSNHIFVFTGNLEIGTVTVPIVQSGPLFSGWNLIGNPYTANLDFEAFFNLNKTQLNTGEYQAIYGYNATSSEWTIWNQLTIDDLTETEVIVPGQGFLVVSKPTNGIITFSPNMRRTGISDDFILNKSSATTNFALAKLTMNMASQDFSTDIYFIEGQSTGLDIGYDAGAFNGNAGGLFTHLVDGNEGIEMAIQTLPITNVDAIVVPLGVKADQGIQFSIGLDITNSTLPNGIDMYLEDTQTNTWTLLNTNDYTLTPNTDITGVGRFYIHFQQQALSTSENELDQIKITVSKKTLHIKGLLTATTQVEIYDTLGRKTFHKDLEANSTINSISLSDFSSGIYIISLKNDAQVKTQKVILN